MMSGDNTFELTTAGGMSVYRVSPNCYPINKPLYFYCPLFVSDRVMFPVFITTVFTLLVLVCALLFVIR